MALRWPLSITVLKHNAKDVVMKVTYTYSIVLTMHIQFEGSYAIVSKIAFHHT